MDGIAPFAFDCGKFRQSGDRLAFVSMRLDHHPATSSNTTPFPCKASAAKEATQYVETVEATHVADGGQSASSEDRLGKLQAGLADRASSDPHAWGH